MSMRANNFKLGLFVIASTALIVAGVIVLGAGRLFEKKIYFETYMTQSVQGLDVGADVKFRGVRLGTVSEIAIALRKYDPQWIADGDMDSPVLVELALPAAEYTQATREQFVAWVHLAVGQGLRARMASSGLTGPAYVELVYLDPDAFPGAKITWTPPELYIPSAPSEIRQIITTVRDVLAKLKEIDLKRIADDLDSLLVDARTKVNDLDMKTLSDDAVSLIENAKNKVDELDVQKISDEAVALLDEVRASNRRLQEILNNPNIEPSLEDLKATLENARDATARIREIVNGPEVQRIIEKIDETSTDLPPAITDIRRTVRRIDRLIASQQSTIEAALEELRKALENVDTVTEDAKDNPSRILFGDPPPRTKPGGN